MVSLKFPIRHTINIEILNNLALYGGPSLIHGVVFILSRINFKERHNGISLNTVKLVISYSLLIFIVKIFCFYHSDFIILSPLSLIEKLLMRLSRDRQITNYREIIIIWIVLADLCKACLINRVQTSRIRRYRLDRHDRLVRSASRFSFGAAFK